MRAVLGRPAIKAFNSHHYKILPRMEAVAPIFSPANSQLPDFFGNVYLFKEQSHSGKLTCFRLVKKFSVFYGSRRYITAFTSAAMCPYLEPVQFSSCSISHFNNIRLNIILPFTPGSSKCLRQYFGHITSRFRPRISVAARIILCQYL